MRNCEPISNFSQVSVYLEMFFNETKLSKGSGLIARTHKGTFLITALHNFTGREPSGKCKSETTGGLPNFVEVTGYNFHRRLPLFEKENEPYSNVPLFWVHSKGPSIDVTVLKLGNVDHALDSSFLDPKNHGWQVKIYVSQLCYVVGYPEGLFIQIASGSVSPIWKTGHIASEPLLDPLRPIPSIYIDASTRQGMSGSPVFLRENGKHRLLGMYVGRTSQLSDIGIVIKPEAILNIIEAGPPKTPITY